MRELGAAPAVKTNKFTQMEANFTLFLALAVQAYEQLTIPDDAPWDLRSRGWLVHLIEDVTGYFE
ncbi:MAG: hypothetical protein ACRD21_08495 [Vicinamibacteria bacterium]